MGASLLLAAPRAREGEGCKAGDAADGSRRARVIAFPWLGDVSKWYLVKSDGVVRPFIFQDREPVEFNALAEESEEAFKRETFLYGVRARYRMAYGYWQYAVRTDFV